MKNLLMLFITLISLNATAQFPGGGPPQGMGGMGGMERPSPEQQAKSETKTMTKKLGLSSEQKEQFQATILKYAKESDELFQGMRSGGGRPSEEARTKMRETMTSINTRREEELKAFLSQEQFDKYIELNKKQQSTMMPPGGGGRSW